MSHIVVFSYSDVGGNVAEQAKQAAGRIRARHRNQIEQIIETGKDLIAVKGALPHGMFLPWIEAEFGWGRQTAQNYMNVASNLPKIPTVGNLPVATLYDLAAPSVSEDVRAELVEVIETSDEPPVGQIKARLDHEKAIRREQRRRQKRRATMTTAQIQNDKAREAKELEEMEAARVERERIARQINNVAIGILNELPPPIVEQCIEVLSLYTGGRDLHKALVGLRGEAGLG